MGFWERDKRGPVAVRLPRPAVTAARRPDPRAVPPSLARVKNLVAIGSGKGGVGKSTVSVNLATALAALGCAVGLLDADLYGPSQPGMLGAGTDKAAPGDRLVPLERHGVKFISIPLLMPDDGPVVWRAPIAMRVLQQFLTDVDWGDLDYLLIDMPPGTGDVQLTLAQQAPLTGAVVVTTPQDVALGVARKGLQMFRTVKVPVLGVVENMSGYTCAHCGKDTPLFKTGGGRRLAEAGGVPLLGTLPLDPAVVASGDDGVPVPVGAPDSPAARAYADLARAFMDAVERVHGAADAAAPRTVELAPDGGLRILWGDGHAGVHTAYHLRASCPCAACVDEGTGARVLDPKRLPLDIRVESFHAVGRYGFAVRFSDGHDTGIYTHEHLRRICECPACAGKNPESFPV